LLIRARLLFGEAGFFFACRMPTPAEANRGPGCSGCAAAAQASQTLITFCIKN